MTRSTLGSVLSKIAAFTCFTSGYKHKLHLCMRAIPHISNELRRLDKVIPTIFIPAVTGGIYPNKVEKKLLSLSPGYGGLGIPIFSEVADREISNSKILTEQLQTNIMSVATSRWTLCSSRNSNTTKWNVI